MPVTPPTSSRVSLERLFRTLLVGVVVIWAALIAIIVGTGAPATALVLVAAGATITAVAIGVAGGAVRKRVARVARLAKAAPASLPRVVDDGLRELDEVAEALRDAASREQALAGKLAAVQHELQAILQSMDGGVVVFDLEQRILSMNRAAEWMLSITGSTSRGRLLQEVSRQPDLHRFVEEALVEDVPEREFALQGAPARRVRAAHSRLLDGSSNLVGLLVVLSDITRLHRLESVRTDFASNVSHELRTPITSIKGYVETLLDMGAAADPEQNEKFLRIIQRNADRLGAIVEDMLMLTQLERPGVKETLVTERTRVSALFEQVQQALEPEADSKGMEMNFSAPPELFAQVNSQLAEQAVSNLVINAIKYSPGGKRVWIDAAPASEAVDGAAMVEIVVRDEGPGIGEEHLARIFERFYRIDKARSRDAGGTGLGLAIVKHIVQMHGGRVRVESELGKGSTFRVLLPAG